MWQFVTTVWNSSIGSKIMLIGGVGILLGALAGILYAVIRKAGDEGVMKTPKGKSMYWPKEILPLMAFYDPRFPEDYINAYRTIAQELNSALGFWIVSSFGSVWAMPSVPTCAKDVPQNDIFLALTTLSTETTVETTIDGVNEDAGATTQYACDDATGQLRACFLTFSPGLTGTTLLNVMRHEIGHTLGLDHDRTTESVMFPTASERPAKFTDKDIQLLKKLYRKG